MHTALHIRLDATERGGVLPNRVLDTFLESLRYAGIIGDVHESDAYTSFRLYAPRGLDEKCWAKANAARMSTFGIDASVEQF